MYVVTQHHIIDPDTFWDAARAAEIPGHLKLLQILPNEEGSHAICLWEAESVDDVEAFMEPALRHVSRNQYFPVGMKRALGLPKLVEA
jgi:hypothetical protein